MNKMPIIELLPVAIDGGRSSSLTDNKIIARAKAMINPRNAELIESLTDTSIIHTFSHAIIKKDKGTQRV
jgi:hypothetical protein